MTTKSKQIIALERGFLGAVFFAANMGRDQEVVDALGGMQDEDLFAIDRHRSLVIAMRDVYVDAGVPALADPIRLQARLPHGTFEDFEALSCYLTDGDIATDLVYALAAIKDDFLRRKIALLGQDMGGRAYANIPIQDLITQYMGQLLALQDVQAGRGELEVITYADALQDMEDEIQENMARRAANVPLEVAASGLDGVDEIFNGGLEPGTLNVLAARPSIGKTALAQTWLNNSIMAKGDPNAYGVMVILEMTAREMVIRDLAGETDIVSSKIKRGTLSENDFALIQAKIAELKGTRNLLLHERVSTIDSCISSISGDMMRKGSKPTMIVIDYLQLLNIDSNNGAISMTYSNAVGVVTRKLKLFAKHNQVPILLLSQLNREVEKRPGGVPMLADLRESGNIEQDADSVCFLYPKKPIVATSAEPTREVGFVVAKNRSGETGEVDLLFCKAKTRFSCIAGSRETDATMTWGKGN